MVQDDDTMAAAAAEEEKQEEEEEEELFMNDDDEEELTWEEKVVEVLHLVRRREITEYNHKLHRRLDLNVVAIKVTESDVGYPISIYGTVLARDEYDLRCVYLFKRGRDNAQIITSPEDTLLLTGPNRALAARDIMYFEFHLKIKGDGGIDKDFSKGLLDHNVICYTKQPVTLSLESCLSIIEFVYTPVRFAVEALVAVSIKGMQSSKFSGKVTAWTSEDDENKIILYDSKAEGTNRVLGDGGSIDLTRRFVAVKLDDALVLNFTVSEDNHHGGELFELVLRQDDEEYMLEQGTYELQVKISWTAALKDGWRLRRRKFGNKYVTQFFVLPEGSGLTLSEWWIQARRSFRENYRKAFDSLFMMICWFVWKERNVRVFERRHKPAGVVVADIKEEILIKGENGVEKIFSKGLLEHNCIHHTQQPMTLSLESWLSTVEFVYTPVPIAVEALVAVSIKGMPSSNFIGKITACTAGDDENKIILYDSEVQGTNRVLGAGGSVDLTRRFVAVKLDDALVLNVAMSKHDHEEAQFFEPVLGHGDEVCVHEQGPYELQVKLDGWLGGGMAAKVHDSWAQLRVVVII
uniref:DUF6598 domain-containing protein n=1 Tax=Leersia perrieri TaxID=77586 RepID=A0A0D9XAR2_9ORYZ